MLFAVLFRVLGRHREILTWVDTESNAVRGREGRGSTNDDDDDRIDR